MFTFLAVIGSITMMYVILGIIAVVAAFIFDIDDLRDDFKEEPLFTLVIAAMWPAAVADAWTHWKAARVNKQ